MKRLKLDQQCWQIIEKIKVNNSAATFRNF